MNRTIAIETLILFQGSDSRTEEPGSASWRPVVGRSVPRESRSNLVFVDNCAECEAREGFLLYMLGQVPVIGHEESLSFF